jgi:hypothetical protein
MTASVVVWAGLCAFVFIRFGSGWGVTMLAVTCAGGAAGGLGGWIAKRRGARRA